MKIPTNEGPLDRTIRIIAGAVLGWLYVAGYATGAVGVVALVFSLLLLVTGIVGYCPMYSLFHIRTAHTR